MFSSVSDPYPHISLMSPEREQMFWAITEHLSGLPGSCAQPWPIPVARDVQSSHWSGLGHVSILAGLGGKISPVHTSWMKMVEG